MLLQILNAGHWQANVGATVGEENEQVNAQITPYSSTTQHMTPESILFLNLVDICIHNFSNRSRRYVIHGFNLPQYHKAPQNA